jgi:hypothetical protein
MAMESGGKFLYAAERQDNAVLVYSVDAGTGALTQAAPFRRRRAHRGGGGSGGKFTFPTPATAR